MLQNSVNGLQIHTNEGKWIDAPFIPNTILVNSGDILDMWTDGRYKSTRHRVVLTSQNAANSRYSLVYFCIPNWETPLQLKTNNNENLVGDILPFV